MCACGSCGPFALLPTMLPLCRVSELCQPCYVGRHEEGTGCPQRNAKTTRIESGKIVTANAMATKRRSKGAYMISAVAEMYAIHPQTLRLYEREGLLRPPRSD